MAVPATKERIVEAAYALVARFGPARTSIEDVAVAAGVSRATMYRYFPGGRAELIDEVVTYEYRLFFLRLYEAISDAETLEEVIELGLRTAHRAIEDHDVLQMILRTEPEILEPALRAQSSETRELVAWFLTPYLERHELAPGVEVAQAADFLARMVLSYVGAAGRWNLDDPDQLTELVRGELLSGIVPQVPADR